MQASELIRRLQTIVNDLGDAEVFVKIFVDEWADWRIDKIDGTDVVAFYGDVAIELDHSPR